MITWKDILKQRPEDWMEFISRGFPIDPHSLDDTLYHGISLGLPRFIEKLSWKTFAKVFYRDPGTQQLRGWNIRVEQRGLDAPTVPLLRNGKPFTFGHYAVTDLSTARSPVRVRDGLLIDYGRGGNALFDPLRFARDPLVALERNRTELLLGWTYLDLGPAQLRTPSFFLLEREGPLTHRANPPRSTAVS